MDRSNPSYRITLSAIMFAVIFVAFMIDKGLSLALPIAMALFALTATFSMMLVFNDWLIAVLAGTFMGVASLLKELIFPSISFMYVVNPLVSVVPRILMSICAFGTYKLMLLATKNMTKPYKRQILSLTVAVFVGLAVNTVTFLSALNLCKLAYGVQSDSVFLVIKAVLYTNIIPEYLVSMLAVGHIVIGVRRGLKLGIDANNPFGKKELQS